jgi:RNA polymerase sigma-70 factor (ECF subfamily)
VRELRADAAGRRNHGAPRGFQATRSMEKAFAEDTGVQWMLAYQRGDEAAFDRLVEAYSAQLYALFTRFLGPVPEREDLVQEAFLRVIRARERYEPTARFSTWLYRIAFNLSVNQTQRTDPEQALDVENPPGGSPAMRESFSARDSDPARALEQGDVVTAVRAAIAALPEAQRMALILAKYEEMPYSDIAVVLRSSEKAIKSMVHRARENLRARLAPFLQQEAS